MGKNLFNKLLVDKIEWEQVSLILETDHWKLHVSNLRKEEKVKQTNKHRLLFICDWTSRMSREERLRGRNVRRGNNSQIINNMKEQIQKFQIIPEV